MQILSHACIRAFATATATWAPPAHLPARRARRVGCEPCVNADNMIPMSTMRQDSDLLTLLKLRQAYCAIFELVLITGWSCWSESQLWQRVESPLVEASVRGMARPTHLVEASICGRRLITPAMTSDARNSYGKNEDAGDKSEGHHVVDVDWVDNNGGRGIMEEPSAGRQSPHRLELGSRVQEEGSEVDSVEKR